MIAVSPLFWSTLALAVVLGAVTVALVVEIVRGHVSVTVPWGRRWVGLAERTVEIGAPRGVVAETLLRAARGETPPLFRGERTEVLDAEDGLVVNTSLTASRYGLVRAVEMVRVGPDRVTYLHLSGPLPGTEEEFALRDSEAGTTVTYRGRIPVSFWALGRLVARALIVPEYERLIAVHMEALRRTCEARARRRPGAGAPPGSQSPTTST